MRLLRDARHRIWCGVKARRGNARQRHFAIQPVDLVRLAQSHIANPNSERPLITAPSITLAGRYSNLTGCCPDGTGTD